MSCQARYRTGGWCCPGPGAPAPWDLRLTQRKRPWGIRTAVALAAPGGCQATGLRAVPEARGWLWGPAPPAREELPGEDGSWERSFPRAGRRAPEAPDTSAGLQAKRHAPPTPAANGAATAPPPSAQGGGGRGAVCSGSEHSLGPWVLLGRLEARSGWSVQVVEAKPSGRAGPQQSGLHAEGRVVVSEGPQLRQRHGRPLTLTSAERRAPGAVGGVWGQNVGALHRALWENLHPLHGPVRRGLCRPWSYTPQPGPPRQARKEPTQPCHLNGQTRPHS